MSRKDGTTIEAIIDTRMLDKVNLYSGTWYPHWNPHTRSFYAYGVKPIVKRGQQRGSERIHRWIMDNPEGMVVDHINGNTLDNRLENLQVITNAQNIQKSKISTNNRSGVKGVWWDKRLNRWYAAFRHNGSRIHVGCCVTLEEAKKAIATKKEELNNGFNVISN